MRQEEAGDTPENPSPKKQRHVWTLEAHQEFVGVVERLGDSKQAPQPQNIWKMNSNCNPR